MNTTRDNDVIRAERSAKRFWVSLVVGLLGLQLVIGFTSIRLALGDQFRVIVPDYHGAALDWDQTKAAFTRFESRGWQLEIQQLSIPAVAKSDDAEASVLSVQVKDSDGQPVTDLGLSAQAYHHARAGEVYNLGFEEQAPGRYQALGPFSHPGLWQLNFSCSIDGQPARHMQTVEIE